MIYLLCIIILSLDPIRSSFLPDLLFNTPIPTDRIAIIGAGPAGVHMAYKLKKAGFNDITIFEKSNRIGGKSLSFKYGGVRHEMGTCFLSADYDSIVALVQEVNAGDVIGYPDRAYWINETNALGSIGNLMEYTGISDLTELLTTLGVAASMYVALHQRLFGSYEGTLMPTRPSQSVLNEIRGTFREFLERNDLKILEVIFNISTTSQGYGYPDRIPALYGLMWLTPKLILSLLDPSATNIFAIDEGYQQLWEKMVRDNNIDVEFGVNIKRIRRRGITNMKIDIEYEYSFTGAKRTSEFDFLILSPSMNSLFGVVDFLPREKELFSKLTDMSYFVTTLVDSDPGTRYSPIHFYMYNLNSPPEYDIWISVDNYASVNSITGDNYTLGITQGAEYCTGCQSRVYYQYGYSKPWRQMRRIRQELKDYLIMNKQENARVVYQKIWPYFIRFPEKYIENGILWDILDLQGFRSTWYIGASVSFESAKSVVEYNDNLLKKAGIGVTK